MSVSALFSIHGKDKHQRVLIRPQAIFVPAFPEGCEVKSSGEE